MLFKTHNNSTGNRYVCECSKQLIVRSGHIFWHVLFCENYSATGGQKHNLGARKHAALDYSKPTPTTVPQPICSSATATWPTATNEDNSVIKNKICACYARRIEYWTLTVIENAVSLLHTR